MDCGNCGRENRPDSRFCSGCGSPLALTCAACDRELAADARFCDGCGAAVEAVPAAFGDGEAVRKTVTALFCDLVGSTAFGEKVDAESAREAMGRYHAMAKAVIEDHGGTVAKFIGDGVMALFGVPEVAPDDAERAVRAGLALQAGFGEIRDHIAARHGVEVGLRVGINTGEVVIADADADLVGDALNTAARLEAACTPGRVLVGESTWRLTRAGVEFAERGEIEAKGKDEPVAAYEVVEARAGADEADELATPFVGRDDELRRLRMVLEDTILERRAGLVSVVGSPGVGKTRLAREMRAAVEGGTRAFELRCERSGTATFAPVAELLRTVAGITDAHTVDEMSARVRAVVARLDDAERVGELLSGFVGAGQMRSTEEMFLAVRRLIEVLGSTQPVVLVVDDIQWAEPLFLDLLEHLAEWVQTVPLLIVCLARPEIREVRPVLAEKGRRVAEVVNLEGLSVEATSELAARLVGADSLPRELLARIPDSTEGNPLFVRELMRMLVDDGVISDASGRWEMMIDVEAVEVPPTINSLLATRVERMSPEERRVLELASVVGSEFPIGAVEAAGDQSRAALEAVFERLRRKELIEPTGSYWGDEPVYRFHHVLIRDAGYRRLLKGARAELHTAVGEWTEQTAASLVGEHEVTIANHFEQAHLYRHELDLDDKETKTLGERAARLFHVAAGRALEREDLAAAASLARRALGCVDDEDEQIAELLLLGCEAVLSVDDVAAGAPLVDRLAAVAGDDPRLAAWVDCFRVQVAVLTDPEGLHDAEALADDAARRLEELGDSAGVAKARIQRAAALVRLARVGECETELDLALSAARAVDDRRRVTAVLGNAPIAALWGPSPVPRAGGRCLDVVRLLRITTGSPAVEATSIRCQAVLEALRGRHDTARSMLDTARSAVEELGLTHDLLETEYYAGLVELLADEPAAAEPLLRKAHDGLGRMGIGADRGQAGAQLARALLLQGRLDEAEELVVESEALAGQNLQTSIASRSVHAEILSTRGRHHEAIDLADEAVATAAGSDILVDHADAVAAQARVRAAAGDAAGATLAAEAANALYEQKGATITVDIGRAAPGAAIEVESAPSSWPESADDWGPAYACLVRSHQLMLDARIDEWAETLTEDFLWDDRRSGNRLRTEGRDACVEAWVAGFRGDPQPLAASVAPVAVRGDDLALARVTLRNGRDANFELEYLLLGRAVDASTCDRAVVFDADDYRSALAELDRLYAEELDPSGRALLRVQEWYYSAFWRKDLDSVLATYAPDIEWHDHRELTWAAVGMDELAERTRTLFDAADEAVGVAERIHSLGPRHSLVNHTWRLRRAGSEQLVSFVSLPLKDPATGLFTSVEQFAEDDLEAARRRLAEVLTEGVDAVAPNAACVVGGVVSTAMRMPEPLLDGLVADPDHLLAGDEPHAFGVTQRRLLATAGDRLALLEAQLADGTWVFSVEEVDDDGRLVGWTLFAADALGLAADFIDTRAIAHLESPAATAGYAFVGGHRNRDDEAVDRFLAEEFELIDHRRLGYPPLAKDDILTLTGQRPTDETNVVTEVLRVSETATLGRNCHFGGEPGAFTTGQESLTVTAVRDGRVYGMELFPTDDLDAASARFEELEGGSRTHSPWNRADALTREWAITSDVAELLGPRVEFEDRRRLVAEPGDERVVLSEMRQNVTAQHVQAVEPIAVRGDLQSLHRMTWRSDDGHDLEWELLTVAEFSDDGHPVRAVVFEVEQLAEAVTELERLHAETLDPVRDRAELSLAAGLLTDPVNRRDMAAVADEVAADFHYADHRPASYGRTRSRDRFLAAIEGLFEEAASLYAYVERWLRIGDGVACYSSCYVIRSALGAEILDRRQVVVCLDDADRLTRFEEFSVEQVDEAIARFEQLVAAAATDDEPRSCEQ